jgi:hypothetical protein
LDRWDDEKKKKKKKKKKKEKENSVGHNQKMKLKEEGIVE